MKTSPQAIPPLFFDLCALCFANNIRAPPKLFAYTKLTKDILQQIIIRDLTRNFT